MRKIYFSALVLTVLIGMSNASFAQILAWQLATPVPSKGIERNVKATTNNEDLELSVLTRGPSAVAKQGNGRGFSGNFPINASQEEAKTAGAYYQFTVKAKPGHAVSLSALDAVLRRQSESAHIYRWTYSIDGKKFTDIGTEDVVISNLSNNGAKQPTLKLATYKELQNVPSTTTITFRLYAWGATADSGTQIAFGFGKSSAAGSNVLAVAGTVTPVK